MMVLDERKKCIVNDTLEILDQHIQNEVIANMAMLMQTIARSERSKPADIEEQLALNYFFLHALETHWRIEKETLDAEIEKHFNQMEIIARETKAKFAELNQRLSEPTIRNPVTPDAVPEGDLMGLASMFGALAGLGGMPPIPPMEGLENVVEGEVVPFIGTDVDPLPEVNLPIETSSEDGPVIKMDTKKAKRNKKRNKSQSHRSLGPEG